MAGVVLENTFTSISAMVDVVMPKWVVAFKSLVLRLRWDSIGVIGGVTAPALFISGTADALVPHAMMRALHDAAIGSVDREWYPVLGGTHNDCMAVDSVSFLATVRRFVRRSLTRAGAVAPAPVAALAVETPLAAPVVKDRDL